MITILFGFANEKILVSIKGTSVKFCNTMFGAQEAGIEGLKLDYAGACREFPDIELMVDWREEVIRRFKEKIKELKTEKERATYLIEDLKGHGYVAEQIQRDGYRPVKLT